MNTYKLNTVFSSVSRGPDGVGVNELKRRLLISDPDRYGVTVPRTTHIYIYHLHAQWFLILLKAAVSLPPCFLSDTSREKRRQENEGVDYHFVSTHMFEEHILNNRYAGYADVPLEVPDVTNSPTWVCLLILTLLFHESDGYHFYCLLITIFNCLPVCARPRFIEYGRYNGHYYGTSLDSMHRVMAEGKVCLLDVHPSVSIVPSKSGSANTFSQNR